MIRIVKGTFIWFDGRRSRRITRADGPQSYDHELEARLVAEGVAEYVDAAPAPEPEQAPAEQPAPVHEVEETEDAEPESLEDMTRAELADYAESIGIKPGKLTKAKLIAAIEEAEQAPSIAAAEVE